MDPAALLPLLHYCTAALYCTAPTAALLQYTAVLNCCTAPTLPQLLHRQLEAVQCTTQQAVKYSAVQCCVPLATADCSNQDESCPGLNRRSKGYGHREATALHCTASHCTALHCTALPLDALHCTLSLMHCIEYLFKVVFCTALN